MTTFSVSFSAAWTGRVAKLEKNRRAASVRKILLIAISAIVVSRLAAKRHNPTVSSAIESISTDGSRLPSSPIQRLDETILPLLR